MEKLQIKKAIFYPTEIVLLQKKENTVIKIADIFIIKYRKPTLLNFFFAGLLGSYPEGPGCLTIYLNKKINKREYYIINIKYKDYIKLREFFEKEIDTKLFNG